MPRGAVPFPFGHCRVCNAQATGNHYGANTCEGCKGFFKRSLGKSEKYKCLNNEKCAIDPDNRIKCKLCRFKRCLELGMSMNAIKMGRIPKVQKQKALDVEKSSQDRTADLSFIEGRDVYRNNDLQSSPPLQEDIEPPKRKQLKSCDSNSSSSGSVPCHGQRIREGYHDHLPERMYSSQHKTGYPMNAMDTHDMVQLLHNVISIDDSRKNHDAVISHKPAATDDYARTLASAGHTANNTPYNNWHSTQPNHGSLNKTNDSGYHAAPKQDYPTQAAPFPAHNESYDYSTNSQYEQHALDAYMLKSGSPEIYYPPFRDANVHPKVPVTHNPHCVPSSPSDASPGAISYHSDGSGHDNRFYSPDSKNRPEFYVDRNTRYEYEKQPQQYQYATRQQEQQSDYGSIDDLSPGYSSSANTLPSDDSDAVNKSVANAYWQLTTDVRNGVEVMEDIIATGSTDRFLPLCRENLPTLWKWIMESVVYYNNMMTKFSMMCPLISSLCMEDKKVLIQHSYISLWLIWNAPLFKRGQTYIPFRSSCSYVYTRNWMEKILPNDFVAYLHEYAERQNAARFSVTEIALLCCLAITPSNVAGVKSPDVVNQLHQTFNELLTKEICKNRVNPKEMLTEIPHLLKLLEVAVEKQIIILQFDHNNPPEIQFP